jgi:topoisomerase-4 subunit B
VFKGKKVVVCRFRGLGDMNPNHLTETTMSPASRSLIKITLPGEYEDRQAARDIVERLMGRDPAKRFEFIQSRASAVEDDAIDA